MTNVKDYTDRDIFLRMRTTAQGFITPSEDKYLIVGIQSNEDEFDKFDDKFYLYKGKTFIDVVSGTTNSGASGLLNFEKYNPEGVLVWQTNRYYQNCFKKGLHNGKMPCLRLNRSVYYYRDSNRNKRAEEIGNLQYGNKNTNFHGCDYAPRSKIIRALIGSWSVGCCVVNDMEKYYKWLEIIGDKDVDYCLLKEW